jgi:hypothetical protein
MKNYKISGHPNNIFDDINNIFDDNIFDDDDNISSDDGIQLQTEYLKLLTDYIKVRNIDILKRGDVMAPIPQGYRNEGINVYNGELFIRLETDPDDYGVIPSSFKCITEIPPQYWSDSIDHNKFIWIPNALTNIKVVQPKEDIKFLEYKYNYYKICETEYNELTYRLIILSIKEVIDVISYLKNINFDTHACEYSSNPYEIIIDLQK